MKHKRGTKILYLAIAAIYLSAVLGAPKEYYMLALALIYVIKALK